MIVPPSWSSLTEILVRLDRYDGIADRDKVLALKFKRSLVNLLGFVSDG